MTDCWICGHPILEGQKVESVGPNFASIKPRHWNPADHLPTLDKVTEARLLAEGLLEDRLLSERERAAKLVVEACVPVNDVQDREDTREMLKDLANRIRSGE